MFKKIFVILFCSMMLFSCGKKGDPEYKGRNNQFNVIIIV